MQIDNKIKEIDEVICENINKSSIFDRGLLSQNILSQLRNLIEHIAVKIYLNGQDINISNYYNDIENAIKYIKTKGKLKFLSQFHRFLQSSVSHYTTSKENSERLMLKYYEFLLKTKKFLKQTYNINILFNINKFPINTDSNLKEYYEKISEKILQLVQTNSNNELDDRYYIEKIKPFFINNEIFYEVTFTEAKNWASKTDRIIAFTKLEILKNYSVKLSIQNSNINIFEKTMPILIITTWEVSILPWEIKNFATIFGKKININKNDKEYVNIMSFLTSGFNLLDIVEFEEKDYKKYKNEILKNVKKNDIFDILEICRKIIKQNYPGAIVIRYLLYCMNNKIIKEQKGMEKCNHLSNLWLKFGCIPFDKMPFASSLINHNPKIYDLFECIDVNERNHEFLARLIKNNTEQLGNLYTSRDEIFGFSEIEKLIKIYNNCLYSKHINRKIEKYNNYFYIKEYENDTLYIIEKIKEMSSKGIKDYAASVIFWLKSNNSPKIDSKEKKEILKKIFENSKVALIYGPAGTGKSTLIDYISNFLSNHKKLYLANTNPAVENLKRKVTSNSNCKFMTIFKFLKNKKNFETKYDLLIIDECSCVSNKDMFDILTKAKFELLILVGDIYQIEAIRFGNWFNLLKKFVPTSSFELTNQYRTKNTNLLKFWEKVRNNDELIIEHITKNEYSTNLNESIFNKENDDEIILCFNYDGLYGINNLNRFLQESNPNPPINLGIKTYKINDPILFNDSNRFSPVIYNNLKGKIVKIEETKEKIQFDIEIDKVINELEVQNISLNLIGMSLNGKSIIQFLVNKYKDSADEDNEKIDNIVPFQIAYAVSIHKAQGLEYNSVKIVITNEIDELITHNIFYTAITRAKEKLKIYWTPETEKRVLESFSKKEYNKDYHLLTKKYNLKK